MNDTTTPRKPTRSQATASDIAALLRARNPLLWVATKEEGRVERYLFEAAASAGYVTRFWDCGQGVTRINGDKETFGGVDPGEMLDTISDRATGLAYGVQPERTVWIMRDLGPWLQGPIGMTTCRKLRNLARRFPELGTKSATAIIIVSPEANVPPELAGHATVIDWPMPDRDEIAAILDVTIRTLPEALQASAAPNGTRDQAIDAAIGLSEEEAKACYGKSLVQLRRIDPAAVAAEKKRIIARERVLEWYDPIPGGLDAVGGLANLKSWLKSRSSAYSPKARAYGLPSPKGALLAGVPGCGKSLTAKAIATAWNVPLLRVDLGALKSKYVGESEGNLRKAFRVIEAIGRCVVWFDELEKALAGATGGAADGGVSGDALGSILSWMQERAGTAFVIATANDISTLPPELLRKGRFDELWFIDLPTQFERGDILAASLAGTVHSKAPIDFVKIAEVTAGFTGAEIAALIPDALFAAFADGEREPVTADLIKAAKSVSPLSKTAGDKIAKLRQWGRENARNASEVEESTDTSRGRQLDL